MPKTPTTSVRCDLEKLNFVKGKEKLDSVQKVVTFLLDKYWWEHKIGVTNTKTIVPESSFTTYGEQKPQFVPAQRLIVKNDWTESKPTQQLSPVDEYKKELDEATTVKEIERIVAASKKDVMISAREKYLIETYAKEVSKEMYTD